jgi:hypothetical protein
MDGKASQGGARPRWAIAWRCYSRQGDARHVYVARSSASRGVAMRGAATCGSALRGSVFYLVYSAMRGDEAANRGDAKRGCARFCEVRRRMARSGLAERCVAARCFGGQMLGYARQCNAGLGTVPHGGVALGSAGLGKVFLLVPLKVARLGHVWRGCAMLGTARHGEAECGQAWLGGPLLT